MNNHNERMEQVLRNTYAFAEWAQEIKSEMLVLMLGMFPETDARYKIIQKIIRKRKLEKLL